MNKALIAVAVTALFIGIVGCGGGGGGNSQLPVTQTMQSSSVAISTATASPTPAACVHIDAVGDSLTAILGNLSAEMSSLYGCTVAYKPYGIGGSTSTQWHEYFSICPSANPNPTPLPGGTSPTPTPTTTPWQCKEVDGVLKDKTHFVQIELGGNDTRTSYMTTDAQYQQNITDLANLFVRNGSKVLVSVPFWINPNKLSTPTPATYYGSVQVQDNIISGISTPDQHTCPFPGAAVTTTGACKPALNAPNPVSPSAYDLGYRGVLQNLNLPNVYYVSTGQIATDAFLWGENNQQVYSDIYHPRNDPAALGAIWEAQDAPYFKL